MQLPSPTPTWTPSPAQSSAPCPAFCVSVSEASVALTLAKSGSDNTPRQVRLWWTEAGEGPLACFIQGTQRDLGDLELGWPFCSREKKLWHSRMIESIQQLPTSRLLTARETNSCLCHWIVGFLSCLQPARVLIDTQCFLFLFLHNFWSSMGYQCE